MDIRLSGMDGVYRSSLIKEAAGLKVAVLIAVTGIESHEAGQKAQTVG